MKIISKLFILTLLSFSTFADDIDLEGEGWPKDLVFEKGVISIYQPQIEKYENDKIEARAAIAVKIGGDSPVFGAVWFTGRVLTDRDEHLVTFNKIEVETVKFPEGDAEQKEKIQKGMTTKLDGVSLTMSLDRFSASIEPLLDFKNKSESFNNDPPVIYYETKPAVLVYIDGDPILKELDDSKYKYVMNTPFFIVQNTSDKKYYLKGGKWWYSSKDLKKGWESIKNPPTEVTKIAEEAFQGESNDLDSLTMQMDSPPKVIISTKPAELIQTDGEPKFEPVKGTDLLFLTNSESDIIMDIKSLRYFILISGRWYTTKQLDVGDWKYISPDDLPDAFIKIPEESDISDVRYSVPGTAEAKDALLENSVPQTAEIDRSTATVEVQFDGDPKFVKIESTAVSYAENSDKTVLLIDGKYYAVDEAVWFSSNEATGPWEVCVEIPEEVQDIPPESPVYNVKYVYVYDYTPTVVYVGYTPGYYGSYV